MKKILLLTMVAFVGVVGWIVLEWNSASNDIGDKPVIKIGVSLPLTGNIDYMGQAIKGAILVAIQDLEHRNLKNKYEFIVEDNAYDAKRVNAINSKFLYADKVGAIVDFASIPGLATAQFAEKNEVIHFNACASDRNVANGRYNFLHTTLPDMEAKLLIGDVVSKYKNVALVVLNDASGNATSIDMRKEMDAQGIRYTEYLVNPGTVDMRALIEKIEKEEPDVYLVTLYSPTFEIFYKQMREKGINKPITSTHFFDNITNLDEMPDGTMWVAYANPEDMVKQRILKQNEGVSDYQVCLGNPYDIVNILVDTFESSETKEQAVDYLNNMKSYSGVFGEVKVDEDGVINTPPIKKKLMNGQVIVVKE